MQFVLRQMSSSDVDACFELVCERPGYKQRFADPGFAAAHKDAWRAALIRPAVVSGLVETGENAEQRRILACGFAAFVRRDWLRQFLRQPFPNAGARILDQIAAGGDDPILTEDELRLHNSGDGLCSFTLHVGWSLDRCPPDHRLELRQRAAQIFIDAHDGYRMREFVAEVFPGAEFEHYVASGAWQVRHKFRGASDEVTSVLVGRSREEVLDSAPNAISPLAQMFVWRTPRFHFTPEQQRFLTLARQFTSDKELCKALGVTTSSIARRFDRIYRRVERLQDPQDPVLPAGTSPSAKRGLLLNHLRRAMHELRPYVASPVGSSAIAPSVATSL